MSSSAKQYILQPYIVLNQTAVTSSKTSSVTEIMYKDNLTYQIAWTGNLVGVFTVETSLDPDQILWDTVPFPTPAATGGSANHGTIELNQLGAKFVRLVYTHASGTGNIIAFLNGKVI